MIRAVLVDDELHNVENLQWKIERFCPSVEVVATFTNPDQAIDYLKSEPPDLLFLDVEMPLLTGFDLLDAIGPNRSFKVIFVTAHAAFGIQALKANAMDYILKPVHNKDLTNAIEKFQAESHQKTNASIHQPEPARPPQANRAAKIALASKDTIEFVVPSDILVCEADSNYTVVYLADGSRRVISKTLKEFEEMLIPHGFFRPHLSFIINLDQVREFHRSEGGHIVMTNQMNVPVSKSRRADLLTRLGG